MRNSPQKEPLLPDQLDKNRLPDLISVIHSVIAKVKTRSALAIAVLGAGIGTGYTVLSRESAQENQAQFTERFNERMNVALRDMVDHLHRVNLELRVVPDIIDNAFYKSIIITEGGMIIQPTLHRAIAEPFSSDVTVEPIEQLGEEYMDEVTQFGGIRCGVTKDGHAMYFYINNDSYWAQTEHGRVSDASSETNWHPIALRVNLTPYTENSLAEVLSIQPLVEKEFGHFVPLEYTQIPENIRTDLSIEIPLFYEAVRSYIHWAAPLDDLTAERTDETEMEYTRRLIENEDFSGKLKQGTLALTFTQGGNSFDCSGVIIAKDAFMTSRHCILDHNNNERTLFKIKEFDFDGTDQLPVTDVMLASDLPVYGAATFHPDEKSEDIALISFNGYNLFSEYRIMAVNDAPLTYGTYLTGLFVDYGTKQRWAVKDGTIDPKTNLFMIGYDFTNQDGNSGGPIVDRFAQVVGLHSLGDDKKSYAPVITALKVAALKDMADQKAQELAQKEKDAN